jgi:hypothetical protein
MASNNPLEIKTEVKPVNEGGRLVIATAQSYLGTAESPALSDTGTQINIWNSYFGQSAIPWAGSFATAMYVESLVSDQGIGDPNPYVMYQRAAALDRVSPIAFPGCYVVYGTFAADKTMLTATGVDIFVRWHDTSTRQAVIIGGNIPLGSPVTNHTVQIQFRNMVIPNSANLAIRAIFLVPKAVSLREADVKNVRPDPYSNF